MAGRPLLAAWDGEVLRTYQFTTGQVFAPLATVALDHATPVSANGESFPLLAWDRDDAFVLADGAASDDQSYHRTYSPLLAPLDEYLHDSPDVSDAIRAYASAAHKSIGARTRTAIVYGTMQALDGSVTFPSTNLDLNSDVPARRKSLILSRDANFMLIGYNDASQDPTRFFSVSSGGVDNQIFYSAKANPPFTIDVHCGAFAPVGDMVVVASAEGAQCWDVEKNFFTWTWVHDIPLPAGVPQRVIFSPSGKLCAIVTLNGGVYTTRIFNRVGTFLQEIQTIVGLGKLLSFSGDEVLLVDAGLRVCYIRNGNTYESLGGAMANVATQISVQALSSGRVYPDGITRFYDAGVERLIEGYGALKLTLLKPTAPAFDRTFDTLAEVLDDGAEEVTGGLWPAGGISVPGLSSDRTSEGVYRLLADEVKWLVLSSSMTFRRAVIYDTTDDMPILDIDFQTNRVYPVGREMALDPKNGVLVTFTA